MVVGSIAVATMTSERAAAAIEDRAVPIFVSLAALASLLILWLGRGLTFFSDEWAFIERRSLGDPSTWFAPHNEHWVTLPIIAYRLLVESIGLGSYLPYLLLVVALHVVVAALVFRLVRRRAGAVIGLAASIVVLFFGAGFENLFWGFQIGFVGAMVCGLGVFDLLDGPAGGRRAAAVAALLLVALATQGDGLFFVVGAAIEMLLRPEWRRRLVALLIPIGIYGAWYVAIGSTGIGAHRDPFSLASVLRIPEFVVSGAGGAAGAVTGVGPSAGLVVAVLLAAWVARMVMRREPIAPRFLACAGAIVAAYALIALTRAGVTVNQVHYTRYTYVTGILLIVGLAALIGPRLPRLAGLAPRRRLITIVSALAVLELALLWNVSLLVQGRTLFVERAALTRALVAAALAPDRPVAADLDRSLILVPSPHSLERIVAEHGSPVSDWFWGSQVEPLRPELLTEANRRLVEGPPIYPDEEP
jgi:hypothetical protein